MYDAGAADYFDILAANAFGFDLPPEDPPDAGVLNFRRVELLRAIMEDNGDGGKAVWFNEYGWNAAPEEFSDEDLIWKRVSEEEQAEYTLQGIAWGREQWPWAGVFNIWYFRQTGSQYPPDDATYYFRMVDTDFTPRRMYDAVQDAAGALFVASAGRVEETHPAVVADVAWSGAIEDRASGGGLLQSSGPGASLTFTFRGHSVDLIAWRGSQAGRLLVTLDGHNVAGLPVDASGRSYLDLGAEADQWQARLPIAQGLTGDQHVVRLTASEASLEPCNVDAFEVNAGQPPSFPAGPVAGLGAGLLLVAGALVWELRSRPRPERFF
jgi:hypothetical protein